MGLEVEINGISDLPSAVLLTLPTLMNEAGSTMLVSKFKALSKSGLTQFVVDLSQTERIGDAALGALNHMKNDQAGQLILLSPCPKVEHLIKTVGLEVPIVYILGDVQSIIKES